MKLFHRQLSQLPANQNSDAIVTEITTNQLSDTHLHPNYRHWSWFKPHNLSNHSRQG